MGRTGGVCASTTDGQRQQLSLRRRIRARLRLVNAFGARAEIVIDAPFARTLVWIWRLPGLIFRRRPLLLSPRVQPAKARFLRLAAPSRTERECVARLFVSP